MEQDDAEADRFAREYFAISGNDELETSEKQQLLCRWFFALQNSRGLTDETKQFYLKTIPRNVWAMFHRGQQTVYDENGARRVFPPSAVDLLYEKVIVAGIGAETVSQCETIEDWERLGDVLTPEQKETVVEVGDDMEKVRVLVNLIPGPRILKSQGRGYGLFADKEYSKQPNDGDTKQPRIMYGGMVAKEGEEDFTGPYVATNDYEIDIDSLYWFKLNEKGRWINDDLPYNATAVHSTKKDKIVIGVRLGKTVQRGDEFFLNYGADYNRYWIKKKQKCLKCGITDQQLLLYCEKRSPHMIFCSKRCQRQYHN